MRDKETILSSAGTVTVPETRFVKLNEKAVLAMRIAKLFLEVFIDVRDSLNALVTTAENIETLTRR